MTLLHKIGVHEPVLIGVNEQQVERGERFSYSIYSVQLVNVEVTVVAATQPGKPSDVGPVDAS